MSCPGEPSAACPGPNMPWPAPPGPYLGSGPRWVCAGPGRPPAAAPAPLAPRARVPAPIRSAADLSWPAPGLASPVAGSAAAPGTGGLKPCPRSGSRLPWGHAPPIRARGRPAGLWRKGRAIRTLPCLLLPAGPGAGSALASSRSEHSAAALPPRPVGPQPRPGCPAAPHAPGPACPAAAAGLAVWTAGTEPGRAGREAVRPMGQGPAMGQRRLRYL